MVGQGATKAKPGGGTPQLDSCRRPGAFTHGATGQSTQAPSHRPAVTPGASPELMSCTPVTLSFARCQQTELLTLRRYLEKEQRYLEPSSVTARPFKLYCLLPGALLGNCER